jgi:very-short-patch-repair endonuclease
MTARELDRAIEALARRQHGAFSRTQARDLGASTSAIDRRLASGAWIRLAPSVYALPSNPPTLERQCMAAVLCEPTAWVSGMTAAVLHGFPGARTGRIEITVPGDASHRSGLAVVRRSNQFDATHVNRIPIGTVAQTVCDLAVRIDPPVLEDVLDTILSTKVVTVDELIRRFERLSPGAQRRRTSLRAMLALRSAACWVPPASTLEAALYGVLDDPRLPPYSRQAAIPWRVAASARADAFIPSWRLFVEADGRAWHTRVADFARDRQRDREALAHGCSTARFTYDEIVSEPEAVIIELLRIAAAQVHEFGA